MRGTTHVSAGLLTAAALSLNVPCTILVIVGALLPDIDTPTSKISHATTGIPGLLLGHRGVTHSLSFAAVLCLLSPFLALGVMTHIILDMLNSAGVRLFWPMKTRVSLASIRTSGIFDYALCGLLVVGAVSIFLNR